MVLKSFSRLLRFLASCPPSVLGMNIGTAGGGAVLTSHYWFFWSFCLSSYVCYSSWHTGQFQLMSRQGRFCPRCHVKVDLEWHPQIPCFCLNKDTKVLSNLFICQLFYVIHVPLHHVRHIHLLLLCQAANMSRKRADKSCGHGKIIPFFPGIGQSA